MRLRIHAAAALAIVCVAPSHAQQYSFQYYGVDQGLTDLAVRALYQDAKGFLWLSTENGVFRYDGEAFQPFGAAEGLPSSNAAVFGEAPDGSLLVGGKFGLYRKPAAGNRFAQVLMPGASTVTWGSAIQADGHGTTYVATDAGLMMVTATPGTTQLRMRMGSPPHTGPAAANAVLVENGSVWWGCGDELCVSAGGQTTVYGPAQGIGPGVWKGIMRAGNGDLWVQGVAGKVAVMRHGNNRFDGAHLPLIAGFGPRGLIEVDADGHVLIPIDDGLLVEDGGRWQKVGRAAGLRGPVYAALQDREGSVWLGLAGHGLAKWLGYGKWEYFNTESGLGSDLAYQVAPAHGGGFWAGTDAGLFLGMRTPNGWSWKRQPQLGDLPIHSVRPDGHGKLWLGTEGRGAARLNPATGEVEWFGPEHGLTAVSPYTMMLDRENRIWAASLTGLFVADTRTLRFRPVEGLPGSTFCLAIMEAANGDIWAGTKDGLFQLSGGVWRKFTTADGLSNNEVLSLAADENGDIWVGYQFGDQIDRIHKGAGGWSITREKGENAGSKGTTYFLGFDARGRLWAGTNRGVDVRSGGVWDHFDHHDGLVWDDCDLNGFLANPDGTVWIGTSGGLALFSPRDRASLTVPPVTILTKLTLGKKAVDPAQSVSVGHTANSLTVRFSALTFARENAVLFRYRLTPLFRDWIETRERELEFPGLPSNSYRLEVQARDGWGRWSAESAVFSFEVRPPFWRLWWFITLCAMIPLAVVAMTLRLRGDATRRREHELVRLVDERTAELKLANGSLQEATSQLQDVNQHLVQLSTLDGLTGIANRRAFDLTLNAEWERARRAGTPLSVILADVDYFKRLNDADGHQVGDECLRLVAQALDAIGRRGTDYVARYGGEEFALLLPGADEVQAAALAETARHRVEKLAFSHPDSPAGDVVTISLGTATVVGSRFLTANELVGAADCALYAAKHQGRNKVVSSRATDSVARDLRQIGDLRQEKRTLVPQSS